MIKEGGVRSFWWCISFRITDLALKSARIVEFCGKSRGFADFENPVDRGSAVNFGADSGLCLHTTLITYNLYLYTIKMSKLTSLWGRVLIRYIKNYN